MSCSAHNSNNANNSAPDMRKTQFLNVDLELKAKTSLKELATELDPQLSCLYAGPLDGYRALNYETSKPIADLDGRIREMVRVLKGLSPAGKKLLKACAFRDFNIGVEGGIDVDPLELHVDAETVAHVAALDARIVVTVYAAEQPIPASERPKKKKPTKKRA